MRGLAYVRFATAGLVILALTACPRREPAVIIPNTTVVVGGETLAALTEFDPEAGTMRFGEGTAVLDTVDVDDVMVAAPSEAAPYGFLRKVTSIDVNGSEVVVETQQALLTEAITKGSLDYEGTLDPDQLASITFHESGVEGRVIDPGAAGTVSTQALGDVLSEGYNYEVDFDVKLEFTGEAGPVEGEGSVRAWGKVRFNAGFGVGLGIEACFEIPPVCMDRFEAHVGVQQYVEMNLEADVAGKILEEKVLATFDFDPIVFWIGPIPIVIVPSIDIVVGARGEANVSFRYSAVESAQAMVGAKWTDPDDNGKGWEDLSKNNGLQTHADEPEFEANLELRAYGRADAQLLLYDVVGPEMGVWLGVGADVKIPRRPLWRLFAHFGVRVGFKLDLLGVVKAGFFQSTLFEFEPTILEAGNSAPRFSNVKSDAINVDIGVPVVLGPRAGFSGYFDVSDPEGDPITLSAASNVDGNIPLTPTFNSTGTRRVTVTARDDLGASSNTVLTVNVNNSLPIITVVPGPNTVPATTQYFLSAGAWDPETGEMPCGSIKWFATAPDTIERLTSGGSCGAVAVFAVEGIRTVRVEATDQHGGTAKTNVSVTVTAPPPNLPPILDTFYFRVLASKGPKSDNCITGFWCIVPENGTLYNGVEGDYHAPLELQVAASDPEGDPVTIVWTCTDSIGQSYAVTDNGDGTFGCSPGWGGGSNGTYAYMSVYATDGERQSATLTRTMWVPGRV